MTIISLRRLRLWLTGLASALVYGDVIGLWNNIAHKPHMNHMEYFQKNNSIENVTIHRNENVLMFGLLF